MSGDDQQLNQGKKRPRAKTRMSRMMLAFLAGDLLLLGIACVLFLLFAPALLPALSAPVPTKTPLATSTPTEIPLTATVTLPPTDIPPTPTPSPTPTLTPLPTIEPGTVQVSDYDGMNLRYVPAGEFMMGNTFDDALAACSPFRPDCVLLGLENETPPHSIKLNAFWIDETEVTNGKYALCVAENACQPPLKTRSRSHALYYGNPAYIDYPVIYVSWQDAAAYCAWAGRALPTEAQWEKAARGTEQRIYPWGAHAPNASRLNYNLSIGDVAKVGNYPLGASPYGVLDLGGNVWEWVNDWYAANYYTNSPASNPSGPILGQYRVTRGGAWDGVVVRASERATNPPTTQSDVLGFRCALSAP
jgi:formylglycine-generating enzyme required for sulfatase activity